MKKKIEIYLYQSSTSTFTYCSLSDMSSYGDVLLAPPVPLEIDFNLYDEGILRQKEIESIDEQINILRDESLRKIIKLGERRQELLAINHEQ